MKNKILNTLKGFGIVIMLTVIVALYFILLIQYPVAFFTVITILALIVASYIIGESIWG